MTHPTPPAAIPPTETPDPTPRDARSAASPSVGDPMSNRSTDGAWRTDAEAAPGGPSPRPFTPRPNSDAPPSDHPLFGERSTTIVAAEFVDRGAAEQAAAALAEDEGLRGEVTVIGPDDPRVARRLEPEQRGIWHTMVRSHLLLGTAGAALGAIGAALLIVWPWPAAVASPWLTTLVLVVFGAFAGMLVAGLLSLRPDHGRVIRAVHEALARRHWAVVVRPLTAARAAFAVDRLRAGGAAPLRSF